MLFEFLNYSSDKIIVLLLIMIRISGLVLSAPIFSDKTIPNLLKAGMVVLFSLVLMPVVSGTELLTEINSIWSLLPLILNEVLIGLIIGLVFRLIFIGVQMAGSIVGYQIGFMFAESFDPNQDEQVNIISRFWYVLAMLLFLSINGHHLIINGFSESFNSIPLGNFNVTSGAGEMIIKYSAYIFIIAFKIAAPIIITLFLTDVALGMIARTMPSMNIFFVGMPIKIGGGLLVMAAALPLFVYVFEKSMSYFNVELSNLLAAIGRA